MKSKAAYMRVSTKNAQDFTLQLTDIKKYIKYHEMILSDDMIFTDKDSGAKEDRKGLEEMFQAAESGSFDTLIIWSLDRLSREGIARMSSYLERLKKCNVRLVSIKESWLDTAGPMCDLLIAIFSWVAQQERIRISERITSKLNAIKKTPENPDGIILGRPTKILDAPTIKELLNGGMSVRQVAVQLHVSHQTIYNKLKENGYEHSNQSQFVS